MAHPYAANKSLHTDRLGKMLSGMTPEAGPKATHSDQMGAMKGMNSGMSMHGGKAKLARGGRTKGKTNININVMPAAPDAGAPPTMPAGMGALPPPMAKPPMAPPPGPPPGMAGPGMPPPMMPHKFGGRSYKAGGSVKDGRAWAEGLKNGTKVQHAGQSDAKDINRPPVITRKSGGRLFSEKTSMKDIKNKDGGNGGKGRLAKARLYGSK